MLLLLGLFTLSLFRNILVAWSDGREHQWYFTVAFFNIVTESNSTKTFEVIYFHRYFTLIQVRFTAMNIEVKRGTLFGCREVIVCIDDGSWHDEIDIQLTSKRAGSDIVSIIVPFSRSNKHCISLLVHLWKPELEKAKKLDWCLLVLIIHLNSGILFNGT